MHDRPRPDWLVLVRQIEAIGVHHLGPGRNEVADKLLGVVVLCIDLGEAAQDRVRAEYQIGAGGGEADLATFRSRSP